MEGGRNRIGVRLKGGYAKSLLGSRVCMAVEEVRWRDRLTKESAAAKRQSVDQSQ